MKYKAMKFFAFIAFLLMPCALFAQQRSPLDDPQQLKQIDNSVRGILEDAQWQKFLKSGAAKEKKARDKREAKRGKQIERK